MRPLYESNSDIENEQRLIKLVAKNYYKLPLKYRFDYFVDAPIAKMWEIKVRHKTYLTWMVSLSKLIAAKSYEAVGIEAWALIDMAGVIYKMRFMNTPIHRYSWGGRADRNDQQDMEPVVHYKLTDMARV